MPNPDPAEINFKKSHALEWGQILDFGWFLYVLAEMNAIL